MKGFKVDIGKLDTRSTVYLLELDIDGKRVVKVGITSRSINERCLEILGSVFGSYRYFPYCRPKRFRKVNDAVGIEQKLLEQFKEFKYEPEHKFSGYTELLDIEVDKVVDVYEKLVAEDKASV